MKPFLLLATRPEDEAADDEYEGFLSAGGLTPDALHRVRLEAAPLPAIRLDDYSGVIVGGSPFNAGDPEATKSVTQVRVEAELQPLLDLVVARDFPFLGACYGIGLLTAHGGGVVDGTWPEDAGPTRVSLTEDGAADPLFGILEPDFEAFVGHKEACTVLPRGAVLLATGENCPVQAFRVGRNVYATQFHPELTNASILTRIRIYRDNGYFKPDALTEVIANITAATVTQPANLMRAFVRRFGTE
ncbi:MULTISPECIES: glutamine amidotransferase [unclassified Cryobacterium]|uniref:glutamine amidotransferase n=1 Tax=unclassified Cryobacterium TaxID=2649013 RepID=UPI002AB4B6E7|nr:MULTISPECIES: glutamine amidotransferase [unclassified Cryobacterium]MDY7543462.1 glutamine amidotransferase [Cryobacterium sp. 5B3]MEA9999530.1 glutamine amidotransferase [Cryobacterium sp. RTS3]MEB0267031.1 glutamine amidotransferase [Cryobacterium sp. 10I5]MEB0274649.1 glutamine amidotransferase [Cryobacterium sp. 5B3]